MMSVAVTLWVDAKSIPSDEVGADGIFVISFQIGPESDFSITDYSESIDFEPKYWVAKWSITARKVNEFTYLLSDGTFGFFLHDRHFKRTPDKV